MDGFSGKRAGDGLLVSRKGSALVLRDASTNRERNPRLCSRIGCSGSPNSPKANQVSCSEKAKSSRLSFRSSSSGKEIVGNSSRTCSAISNTKYSLQKASKKLSPQLDTDSSETVSVLDEQEVPEPSPLPGKIHQGLRLECDEAESSATAAVEVGSSSMGPSTRVCRNFHEKSGLGNQDTPNATKGTHGSASRYRVRNLRCNAAFDVVPSGSSSSNSNLTRTKDIVRKRICEGESSSSAKGKRMSGLLLEGRNNSTSSNITITDSRRVRNGLQERDSGAASVRTRRTLGSYPRGRVAGLGSGNNLSPNDTRALIPQISRTDVPIFPSVPSPPHQFPVETSLSRPSSYSRPGSNSESLRGARPSSPVEGGNNRSLLNRESFRQFNMEGIAEVLLALERIEQDEELTYEQLLVLETNLFLNGLSFHDQHRDMRLDIDNMSYEELLALEERMGTVSTALSEEALSECLQTGFYHLTPAEEATAEVGGDKSDVKCSICQEEYIDGDEVGRLQCEHRYHVVCVQQWLRLKNWCPICKASAVPTSSPPPAT